MIRSVLTLHTSPAQADAVLELYRREEILQESLDLTRALSSEIATAIDGSGEIIVTAEWPDEAAYQEWLDHPNRGRTGPELSALLADARIGVGRLFKVDHRVSRTEI
ncbi:putative quinol monooxygenase [Microbacterium sp. 22195]|uniref:putative quinol monooxygenase n=1 Tax=Microbacterium sp. 22195 TaxID=3453891 RepID=UPI003F8392CD